MIQAFKSPWKGLPVGGWISLILLLGAYLFHGFQLLDRAGLDYDELLFVNAALGNYESGHFITYRIGRWVILDYLYIGALKSWIYQPIFSHWGFSAFTVRIPTLLISGVSLLLAFLVGRNFFHWWVGLALVLWLCLDASFLNLQRFDKGPTALETFFKLSALWILTWNTSFRKKFGWLALVLVLGVFNKFNFLWFVNALFGTYQVTHWVNHFSQKQAWKKGFTKAYWTVSLSYVSFLGLFFSMIAYLQIQPQTKQISLSSLISRFDFYASQLVGLITQRGLFQVFGWQFHSNWSLLGLGMLLLFTFLGIFLLISRKTISFHSSYVKLWMVFFFLSAQYILMPEADKVWHIFLVGIPFVPLIVLATAHVLHQQYPKAIWGIVPIFLFWGAVQIRSSAIFEEKLQNDCITEIFKPEIFPLIETFQSLPVGWILQDDWGTHSQLLAYFWKTHSLDEVYRYIGDAKQRAHFFALHQDRWLGKEPIYWVEVHPVGSSEFTPFYYNVLVRQPQASLDFLQLVQQKTGKTRRRIRTIQNTCGTPIYTVYQFK